MQNMQHFERELDQRGASSILRLLRNTLFGFDLPRNHFLCGIFARMVRFYSWTETTQFQHEGWITCFGLGLKGWPVMEVFIRWIDSFELFFMCLDKLLDFSYCIGWQNLVCYHQTQKCFFFSERARLDLPPGEGAAACQVDWGDGERSCSCSICSSHPGGINTII